MEVVANGVGRDSRFRLGRAGTVYLIRPDGYIAARGSVDRMTGILDYLQRLFGAAEVRQPDPRTRVGMPGRIRSDERR